jgi:hypothetical protein
MLDLLVVVFWIALLSGFVSSKIAGKNGRNPKLWFAIGFALPIVSIGIVELLKRRNSCRAR